ncbi:unnamed protein product [Cuscuta campestris]|uniref:pectinesterase n=1 Tax=Cuscuta campestris TaxID=132261 RepID=A0A484LAB4_9ASTE|nr:unnamed protein product [Cuscuta campestris]
MADEEKKKNMLVLGVCSLLLVAMVIGLTIGTGGRDTTVRKEISSTEKAIESICKPTSYKEACIKSLKSSSAANATDPKELIQAAMEMTIKEIRGAMNNSTLFKEVHKDPRSKEAFENCQLLAERAIDDLNRTFKKFSEFDLSDLNNWLSDLQTWLSGSLTYQETCLDGFEGISGDYQTKMKNLLTTSMQLTSNALAMATEISSVLSNLGVQGINDSANRRRLLVDDHRHSDGYELLHPDWIEHGRGRLLTGKRSDVKPDLVVAKDGSGKYKTINEALKDIPRNSNKTFVLYIKEGVYEEEVRFFRNMTYLMVMGDGPTKTKITGKKNFIDGVSTFHTATVAALGDYFMARDIGFENAAGPEKHQAVALRVGADRSLFYNCQIDGYQDTLYAHTYRQFYRNCVISGTIDFVFGNGAVVLQNCTLVVRKPLENQQCIVTAQGRIEPRQPTGLVIQNCSFVADPEYHPVRFTLKSYLGRPWKEYSRTVIMESYIDDLIQQDGWLPWNGDFALETLFYTEYNNRGPASGKDNRVKWKGVKELPLNRIERFTAGRFIHGDTWIKSTGLPYNPGFILPPPKPSATVTYSPVVPDETKDLVAQEKAAYDPPKPVSAPQPAPPVQVEPPFMSASSPAPPEDDALAPTESAVTPVLPPSDLSSLAPVRQPAQLFPTGSMSPPEMAEAPIALKPGMGPSAVQEEAPESTQASVAPVSVPVSLPSVLAEPPAEAAAAEVPTAATPVENVATPVEEEAAKPAAAAPPTLTQSALTSSAETTVSAPGSQESKSSLGGVLDFF